MVSTSTKVIIEVVVATVAVVVAVTATYKYFKTNS